MKQDKIFWRGKRVLVTGHEGFLGSWVVDRLLEYKSSVIGIDLVSKREVSVLNGKRDRFRHIKADIADPSVIQEAFRRYRPQIIFHLAAEAIVGQALRDPVRAFRSNIEGTWNILDACRSKRYIQAIIVASSDKAYGSSKRLPYREDTPLRGEYPYDASKSCADILARMYYVTFGIAVCIMRCGNIYGPGDHNFSRIVPDAVVSAVKDKRFIIRSDGSFTRDYIYIEDIVNGYMKLAQAMVEKRLSGEGFNLSNEKPISVTELVKKIGLLSGSRQPEPRILNCVRCEIRDQYLSSQKAKKVLGWKPKYSLDRGLRKTIDWYRSLYAGV